MLLLVTLMASTVLASFPAAAQTSPNPDVQITCDPVTIPIEVYPGAPRSGSTYCTAQNPTSYSEVVTIQVISDIAYAAPGSITIGAGQELSFSVAVRGDLRMEEGSRQLKLIYQVATANGVTNPSPQPKEISAIIEVRQFSLMRLESTQPFIQLRPKTDYIFEYKVYNDGNARDKFTIDVANLEALEEKDFQVVLPQISTEVDPQQFAKIRVQVRTPKKQGWSDDFYSLTLRAESDFSKRQGSQAVSQEQMITIYVRGVFVPGFTLIEPLAMVALAAAVLVGRRHQMKSHEDEIDIDDPAPYA